jgi:DNA-binding transcriptional ArsR family regulator
MGQKRGEMRQRILALLGEHPEGLSAEEIRVYLKAEQRLGDTLQGMRRQGKVHIRGQGKDVQYFVA